MSAILVVSANTIDIRHFLTRKDPKSNKSLVPSAIVLEKRMHCERFPYDAPRLEQEQRWPAGVAFEQATASVWIEEPAINRRLDGRPIEAADADDDGDLLLDVVKQQFIAWRSLGRIASSTNPGTGGRAATELSRLLPKSLVVKVSASGSFSLYRGGKPARLREPTD